MNASFFKWIAGLLFGAGGISSVLPPQYAWLSPILMGIGGLLHAGTSATATDPKA